MKSINKLNQLKIAVIGDIHGQWSSMDSSLLSHLAVDLVLFVGDLGNEDVAIAQKIADLDLPNAVILGNHDAWFSATDWGRNQCPYDRTQEDWVQDQIDILGNSYVGYGQRDFPEFNLSIVGSRPFSWGGGQWRNREFYHSRFGVGSFAESTAKIVAAAAGASCDRLIVIGHNGPTGLGDRPEDICGKDWEPLGGDYGDPDLANAIAQIRAMGKSIPLVAFGHMHHRLRHTAARLRQPIKQVDGTLYLNAARCPRIIHASPTLRNFSIVTLSDGRVSGARLVWADEQGQIHQEEDYFATPSPVIQ
jgi:uncharacterized protein (TIGR04168 family)